MLEAKP